MQRGTHPISLCGGRLRKRGATVRPGAAGPASARGTAGSTHGSESPRTPLTSFGTQRLRPPCPQIAASTGETLRRCLRLGGEGADRNPARPDPPARLNPPHPGANERSHHVHTRQRRRHHRDRVASNERRYDREKNQWVDGDTNWFTVNAFRTLAEHADRSFSKGDRVIISGRLRIRQWSNDGKTGTAVEIEADALGHDLRWGVSRFEKQIRSGAEHPAAPDEPGAVVGSADLARSPDASRAGAAESTSGENGPASTEAEAPSELLGEDGFLPAAA
jgi:single-strand DNA-binding protein